MGFYFGSIGSWLRSLFLRCFSFISSIIYLKVAHCSKSIKNINTKFRISLIMTRDITLKARFLYLFPFLTKTFKQYDGLWQMFMLSHLVFQMYSLPLQSLIYMTTKLVTQSCPSCVWSGIWVKNQNGILTEIVLLV